MCAEYERVERVVQMDVWPEEKDPNHSAYSSASAPPDEMRMVKKFRRAAAGVEEQLPSDLRPPAVLQRTCDYLFVEVIGTAGDSFHKVHHFVWDRTRAIRNDLSIQQVTKLEDVRLAIDCYERIARFHIVSLHQLAVLPRPYDKYDAQQEREQLDRTLLSLMQYYDDSRGRLDLPNEPEFRAYCIIFQLQDPTPDLEDRVQSWPPHIVNDVRVRKALDLYAAACNTIDLQGPLKPRVPHLIAQQDWQRFWCLVESQQVSYLMACVAEIYFNVVRRTALNGVWRSFRQRSDRSPDDWTPELLQEILALDTEDQVHTFCEAYGFNFGVRQDGVQFLDLSSVRGIELPSPDVGLPKQWKSDLVEDKRFGRTLPAIINGLSVQAAQDAGLTVEEEDDGKDLMIDDVPDDVSPAIKSPFMEASSDPAPEEDPNSLFIPLGKPESATVHNPSKSPPLDHVGGQSAPAPAAPAFNSGQTSQSTFGKPSGTEGIFNSKPVDSSASAKPLFNFNPPTPAGTTATTSAGPASTMQLPKFEGPAKFSFTNNARLAEAQANPLSTSPPAVALPEFEAPGTFSFKPSNPEGATAKSPSQGSSAGNSPTQTFPWDAKRTTQNEQEDKPASQPPTAASPPISPEKPPTFAQPVADAATSSQAHASKSETKSPQHHFTSTAAPPAPSNSASPPSPLGRKTSLNKDHKPKTPSPLANSWNFENSNNASATGVVPPAAEQSLSSHMPSSASAAEFDSLLTRIAQEFTFQEGVGILAQYVEFTVQRVLRNVKEEVEAERNEERAQSFRQKTLALRYGKKWRGIFWAKRFASKASKRRERARKNLEELKRSRGSGDHKIDSTMGAFNSVLTQSKAGAPATHTTAGSPSDVVNGRSVKSTIPEPQSRAGSKRTLEAETPTAVQGNNQKRLKSTSHVDDRGRVTKPAPASGSTDDILRRSSFLGYTAPRRPNERAITTKTDYFRLRAMGIQPRGTKRQRDESVNGESRKSSPASGSLSLQEPADESGRNGVSVGPTSTAPSRDDPDEALLARLRAAREKLSQSTSEMKAEVAKEEEMRRSLSASRSSNESPSLARARAEVRMRRSGAGSPLVSAQETDVPAYRLRESRFVPREQYGRAIERAKEIRESRSRDTSRAQSRAESSAGLASAEISNSLADGAPSQPSIDAPAAQPTKAPNGWPRSSAPSWQVSQDAGDPYGFSSPSQRENASASQSFGVGQQFGFDTQPTHASVFPAANGGRMPFNMGQPFFNQPVDQPVEEQSHDFTIQPDHVQEALSHSFGSPEPFFQPPVQNGVQQGPTPATQQDSYLHTQANEAVDLLDSYEDEQAEQTSQPWYANHSAQPLMANGIEYENEDEGQRSDSYAHSNPFAPNAGEAIGGDTEEDVDDDELLDDADDDEETQSQLGQEDGFSTEDPNGAVYEDEDGYADDEELDDELEETEEDVDGEGQEGAYGQAGHPISAHQMFDRDEYGEEYDDEEEYDEEDEEDGQAAFPEARIWNQAPPKNEALQGIGGTQDDAIELSD
jgi:nuclear mRNA export protein SAC3